MVQVETIPIKSFLVEFLDGTTRKIEVGDGEGYFREEEFKGTFNTYQCFIAEKEK